MTHVVNGTITMYEVRDRNDEETTSGYMDNYEEAKTYARSIDGILMEHEFTWEDSSIDTDFRPQCITCDEPIQDNNEAPGELRDALNAADLLDAEDDPICEKCADVKLNALQEKESN